MSEDKRIWYKSPVVTAPVLVIFVLTALSLSRFVLLRQQESQSNIFLVISVIQISVLILPGALYYLAKGRRLSSPMFISPIRASHIIFIIFTLLLFISGTILIKYIYIVTNNQITALSGYFDSVVAQADQASNVGIILSLIVIPAISEEILFRGILLSEYRTMGSVNAVVMSAICFSMLHLSMSNFPIYFFTGIVLGFVTVITRSLLAPILLHLISNFLSIYGSDLFLRVTIQKSGAFFVGFVIIMIFSLSLLFVVSKLEQIYFSYADNPPIESLPQKSIRNLPKVFLSPSFLVLLVVYIIVTVIT